MAAHTSMIHVRVDDRIKSRAADALAGVGLTLSDAVRILLTRRKVACPPGLAVDREAHDAWFRAKVREALDDLRAPVSHGQAMDEAQALINGKRRVRT